jgi:uncharacterized repeat protein (TIGR03803 family)
MLLNNTLYGTTWQGFRPTNGTVFSIHTDGTSFTNLHIFTALDNFGNNSDGAFPSARLIASGNTLFGTAAYGGASGSGVVFKVNVDGTGFTNLHSFSGGSDGANPFAGLLLSGNTLYGTAEFGGTAGSGTVFALNTVDTAFTSLHCFTATSSDSSGVYTNNDGANPVGGLILSSNILYGTTRQGGNSGKGTVFSISFSPQLSVIISAANLILKWPTNYAGFNYTGFTLQSTTNLGSAAFWTTNSSAPVVVNGLNTVTNPISGTQQFFRLSK